MKFKYIENMVKDIIKDLEEVVDEIPEADYYEILKFLGTPKTKDVLYDYLYDLIKSRYYNEL